VSAGWVAGTVRARAMTRRRLGPGGAHALARSESLPDALAVLAASPYGHDVGVGMTLDEAQHAVARTLLWNLRVFAGWLPREGGDRLRVLAGWFEVANTDELLRAMAGLPAAPLFRLGSLGTVAARLPGAGTPAALRRVLATSAWGDPGGETPAVVAPAMRLAWAERVAGAVEPARPWALGGAALLVARELFVGGRMLPDAAATTARRLLGEPALTATTPAGFAAALPGEARWALAGVPEPDELWRAEARWWARVDADSARLLRRPRFGPDAAVGTVGAAAVDAWRVSAALECAARGGGPATLEVFDAVA
jgi:hypothetical protein